MRKKPTPLIAVTVLLALIGSVYADWIELAPIPDNVPPPYAGAALTYGGSHQFYAIVGGGSDQFLRYDIVSNCWSPIIPNTAPPSFSDGAALTADTADGVIYALQGGGSREFWS